MISFPNGIGKYLSLRVGLAAILMVSACAVSGQTPTNIQVSSAVQQRSVARLGVNLGDQVYWDSGQIMKNLIFENPGFEGLKYRTIFKCYKVTANTCQDDNQYNAQPTGFWNGGTYRILSGNAAGATGTVISNLGATTCTSCGPKFTFDRSLGLAQGDYFVISTYIPGGGDQGWGDDTGGGGTITTETTDLSPETPGKQAILLSASGTGQYAKITSGFDTWANLSFIQLNGAFQLTFRAKGVGGNNQLLVNAVRLTGSSQPWISQTLTLTNAWQDYTLTFTANETGSAVGPVNVSFEALGANVELDDVSLAQTNSSAANPTVFRDDVVNALKELNPGTIRMMAAGAALGSDIPNQLQVPFARYRAGFNADGNSYPDVAYGIHEFLQLCQTVGADPWLTIPTATTPAEMTDFIQYLTGNGSDRWSALRIARGQTAPWTSVFNKIHIELGNETWNGSFKGESMNYPAYPLWANQVFGAARQTAGFNAASFDLILSGLAASPGYNQPMLSYSTQHDSFDIAPYLLFSANNEAQATLFGALFAEPEIFNSPGGEVYQNVVVGNGAASATGKTTNVSVYETNLGTMVGNITQAQLNLLTPSIGGGIAHTEHMLQMMRTGIRYQNAFALPQYEFRRSDGSLAKLWGLVVDMGTTNRRRPEFVTQALANSVIGGAMLQTAQSGANPTWNQPLSSDNVQLNGAHYLQSFAFLNNGVVSVVLFNLNQTSALPVIFSGPNAPSGTVQMTQVASANITDNNESSVVVQPQTTTLNAFNPSTGLSLPPFSMTVLTMTSGAVQAPSFSVAGGTYTTAQSVTISDGTPGASIFYTTDGTTPSTSSKPYTGPVPVNQNATIQAMATAPGLTPSSVTSASYVISQAVAALPAFSVASGTYTTAQTLSLFDATSGATIYYTTDGSTPSTNSTKYTSPIYVASTEKVQAVATAPGFAPSGVTAASFVIAQAQAAPPAFSLASGTYKTAQTVSFSDTTTGATIYFTTDGSTPSVHSTKYTTPLQIASTEKVQAIATAPGFSPSGVASASYVIASATAALPTFSVPSGSYTTAQTLSLADATSGATIYYTTDTTTPTTNSTKYTGPFQVSVMEMVKAIATAPNSNSSAVAIAYYIIAPGNPPTPAAKPTFSVAAGTYATAQKVTLSDATAGATIYYTLDGSAPTTNSTKYTAAISVITSETIQAIATTAQSTASAVASATYTIAPQGPPVGGIGFKAGEMVLRGSAQLKGTELELTDGGSGEIAAAWSPSAVGVASFNADFTFQIPSSQADGFTFAIQNASKGTWATGGNGEALGYGGIAKSVAVKFGLYNANSKSESSTTGLLQDGSSPSAVSIDMAQSGISLHKGHVMHAQFSYDGATLTETITDTVTNAVFTHIYPVNIPYLVGSPTAYVGFTASTGGHSSVQNILTWSYSGQAAVKKKK
jgi:hypothetical protein